jgi:poly-beta-1,6-N-acetyl-D-glucosamine synthase
MALSYVLITPARNEADHIAKTLESVVAQTVLPLRWVIVSDGSTDGTDAIVKRFQAGHPWIELVKLPPRSERNFAAKVSAFCAGQGRVQDLAYDVIGNVDGDVSFPPDYFEFLLTKMEAEPQLGVAGTHYVESEFHSFKDSYINVNHVNGQIQLFRRACFEQIGGYQPIKGGGIDWVAVTSARMKGWQTYSFGERVFHHHRVMGTAGGTVLQAHLPAGQAALCHRRSGGARRLRLVLAHPPRAAGLARADEISPRRADGTPEGHAAAPALAGEPLSCRP